MAFGALGLLVVASACSSESTIVAPRSDHAVEAIQRIEVTSPAPSIEVSSTVELHAAAYCRHDMEVEDAELEWSTVTQDLVAVDEGGAVTALRSGTAVVRVTSGGVQGEIVIPVTPFARVVGPGGGEVSYRDGRLTIVVDAAALAEPTNLSVEEVYERLPQSGPGSSTLVPGTAYRFEPEAVAFAKPVELRFRYDASGLPSGVDASRLRVHRLNGDTWAPLATSGVDVGAGTVSGWTESFSIYALLDYRPDAATVVITPSDPVLMVGEHLQLESAILDGSGAEVVAPEVAWSSTSPTVATVSAMGEVVALAPGWATIAAVVGETRGEVTLAVYVPLESMTVNPAEAWVSVGETVALDASLQQQSGGSVHQIVTWTSGDVGVASVSREGTVEGLAIGTTTIRAESGGRSAEVTVHVTATPASLAISPPAGYYAVGAPVQFFAQIADAGGNPIDRPVTWSASDPSVLTGAGLVQVSRPTTLLLTARLGVLSTTAVLIFVAEDDMPASIALDPADVSIRMDDTLTVIATVHDHLGNPLPGALVKWTSGNPAVITVDQTGLVKGVGQGSTLLIARSGGAVAIAEAVVVPKGQKGPPNSVEIWPQSVALEPGGSAAIKATVYDANGNSLVDPVIVWSSSDAGIVLVSPTGILTGVADGTATVSASHDALVGSVTVTVGSHIGGGSGGGEEGVGNNLSWPVIFADGYGMTGLPVMTDAGLRPTAAEGIAVTGLPFFAAGNVADYAQGGVDYYMQKGDNTWQAEWLDGSGEMQSAQVSWGDNLTHHTFSTHGMIRVETSLSAVDAPEMTGYAMTHLYGQGPTEMQGTDGSTAAYTPMLYTVTARLRIEKLDNETMEPVYLAFDGTVADGLQSEGPGSYGAEVNVGGKVVYGYNLRVKDLGIPTGVEKYGWWRLTFSLDESASIDGASVPRGLSLDRIGNAESETEEELLYTPVLDTVGQRSVLEIWIASASGGGGGSHEGGEQ